MNDAYSPLKVFHHQDVIRRLKNGEHVAPIHVQLVPTNRCNQSCRGCAYRLDGYTSNQNFDIHDEIGWSKLQEIVADCKTLGVQAIEITGGGEPTVYPKFLDLCDLVLSSGIKLGVVTNGVKWSQDHTSILSQASWVRFSIDAGQSKTYAAYRGVTEDAYYRVRESVRLLSASDRCEESLVGVGFVLNDTNWKEVDNAARQALLDGANNFRISALFQTEGVSYFEHFYREAVYRCREAEKVATKSFRVFNLFGDRLEDLQMQKPQYSFCGYSKLTTYLGADCNVYTCCMNAYNDFGVLGSFKDQSFQALWESQQVKNKIKSLDARNCQRCMYNNKNTTINYALTDKPAHSEFI